MSATAGDWRVTAQQEVERSVAHVTRARSSQDAGMEDVLRDCWLAFRASGAAVGSWAQGLRLDGASWDDIGAALGLTASQARDALEPLIAQGAESLRARLPSVSTDEQPAATDASCSGTPETRDA